VERAVILSESDSLVSTDFIIKTNTSGQLAMREKSLDIKSVEKAAIENVLQKTKGNLSNAARELGMGRTTLYRKMRKYNLEP
jgi:transcriptional regulator of acetoin/glycerol metabolism